VLLIFLEPSQVPAKFLWESRKNPVAQSKLFVGPLPPVWPDKFMEVDDAPRRQNPREFVDDLFQIGDMVQYHPRDDQVDAFRRHER
jgi:hypothetical protein